MELFCGIGELKMSGLVSSVSASPCPCLHIPSSDCRNCTPLFGVDVRNNPNHTTVQNLQKAEWVWRDRLFYVEVGEWQSLQVGSVCEVSLEVSSGVQKEHHQCAHGRERESVALRHRANSLGGGCAKTAHCVTGQLCKSQSTDYLSDVRK